MPKLQRVDMTGPVFTVGLAVMIVGICWLFFAPSCVAGNYWIAGRWELPGPVQRSRFQTWQRSNWEPRTYDTFTLNTMTGHFEYTYTTISYGDTCWIVYFQETIIICGADGSVRAENLQGLYSENIGKFFNNLTKVSEYPCGPGKGENLGPPEKCLIY
jgi:hypothetical protein